MLFESLDFAYHRDIDNKFRYTLHMIKTLLILCKRQNGVHHTKMLKHQVQTRHCIKSVLQALTFDFTVGFHSDTSAFVAGASHIENKHKSEC